MTDNKKKGDFHRTSSQEREAGGNTKAHAEPDSGSRSRNISGARNVGRDE
jgi:hypothetical protein